MTDPAAHGGRSWLLQSPERNIWEITPQGKDTLLNARPGLVITIYESEKGVILWGCAESVANVIAPESVSLILTSPKQKRPQFQLPPLLHHLRLPAK